MEVPIKAMDDILDAMEKAVEKVDAFKHSKVKLPKAELDLLKIVEDARDLMTDLVQNTTKDRQQLADVFGIDCSRISRLRAVLDAAILSDMHANDHRIKSCRDICQTIENVLTDFGLGMRLKESAAAHREGLTRRRSSFDREEVLLLAAKQEQAAVEAAEAAQSEGEATQSEGEATQSEDEAPAPPEQPEEPPKPAAPEPRPKAARNPRNDAWASSLDEGLVERILSVTAHEELAQFEGQLAQDHGHFANWMVWMVHRAHLNDPTLVEINFTNRKMPNPHTEPRVSPKLAVAMETNSHIERLILPCSNFHGSEIAILAVSLRQNRTLKVLNIDSNPFQPIELESLANAIAVNQTLRELRCNSAATSRSMFEALFNAAKSNPNLCKLGLSITDPYLRDEIDKQITRNTDAARKARNEARAA